MCGGRRADAILIRNARESRAPTRRAGKTRYIRSLAWSHRAVGAGALSAQAPGAHRCSRDAPRLGTHSPATAQPPAPSPPELRPEPEGGAMRSAPSQCAVTRALVLAGLWLAAAGRPLAFSDAGPHVHYGWGEPIRLRHLYTAGPHGLSSCFLRIRADGGVDCARSQSAHSECPSAPVPLLPFTPCGDPTSWHLCVLLPAGGP